MANKILKKNQNKIKIKKWQADDLDYYCNLLHDHVVMVGRILVIMTMEYNYKPLTSSLICHRFHPSPGSLEKWMHSDCVSSLHSGAGFLAFCLPKFIFWKWERERERKSSGTQRNHYRTSWSCWKWMQTGMIHPQMNQFIPIKQVALIKKNASFNIEFMYMIKRW